MNIQNEEKNYELISFNTELIDELSKDFGSINISSNKDIAATIKEFEDFVSLEESGFYAEKVNWNAIAFGKIPETEVQNTINWS